MKKTLYTAKELEQKAGVNLGTLRNLVGAGLPVAKKRKSRRGKPQNLYDAGAVYDWWTHRHIAGKFNWTASAILNRLGKLAGKRSKKAKPMTDAEMSALGFDPASVRAADAVLEDLKKNPPAMPDLSGYENMELPEDKLLQLDTSGLDDFKLEDCKPEDLVFPPSEMTKAEAEAAYNIRIIEKKT